MEPQQQQNARRDLNELWDRLDETCRKLWEEDRVSAIPVQAAVEELRVEWGRLEQAVESLRASKEAVHSTLIKEFELEYRNKIADMEKRLRQLAEHASGLEAALDKERGLNRELLKDCEQKEDDLTRFKQESLKAEASRDDERTRRVEEFQRAFQAKTDQLERTWAERFRSLEAEYRNRRESLEVQYRKAFDELGARESRCREREESLRVQGEDLASRSAALEREYLQKRGELETLKARMQAEINELIRTYQAKTRREGGGP